MMAGEVISEEYILEYGRDCLEMHVGAVESRDCALVVDDLIATGGTLCAAMNLLGNYFVKFETSFASKYSDPLVLLEMLERIDCILRFNLVTYITGENRQTLFFNNH